MPNTPYLDKSVRWRLNTGNLAFHELRYREVADAILDAGLATEVISKIGSGKEADVYLGLLHSRRVAIKAYRYYRTSHRGLRPVKAEELGQVASREFELLSYAFVGGAPVPEPIERDEYMLSMAFLGTADGPAPRLKDVRLEEPGPFLDEVLEGVERLSKAGLVHTDLSPFNILVHDGHPWVIDFADALRVDRLGSSPWERLTLARTALTNGLGSLRKYFRRYGLDFEEAPRVDRIMERLDRFGLMR
ncbi:MAG: phosphotransferase [Euryarchaeota archaeon]|nr:phosphotransferase [Euryarchaeota archaeon]MDE1836804.1 phosphotransferase [Euryarchaeota archaeon]MDE1881120.1 phosphotransferase [Euryarchaeota archaeon]MDE2044788.1 phosphotransferase [Thermoplasmata archaeon]